LGVVGAVFDRGRNGEEIQVWEETKDNLKVFSVSEAIMSVVERPAGRLAAMYSA